MKIINYLKGLSSAATLLSPLASAQNTTSTTIPSSFCVPHPVDSSTQRDLFNAFLNAFYGQKNLTLAFGTYVSTNYTQHNPFVLNGPVAAITYLANLIPGTTYTTLHSTFDTESQIGWVHNRADTATSPSTALTDLYRWSGSCIVEHWDVIEALPANSTNPLALF